MSQLRRSARLASIRARAAQSSSVPEPIPLDDDDTDSLCSPPRDTPVCIECGFELESEDDARVFSCCSSPRHLRCLAPLAVAVDQEVRCPDCPSEFADHVSADWFQRLCLINGVEWSCILQLSDCSVCMEAMTVENNIQVPCCGQFVHTVCLARSFSSRGVDCPFCNQSLADFARSSSFLASSLFHGHMVDLDRAPSNHAIDSLVVPDGFPLPPPIHPLCCNRVGGPPEFEPLDDRRMEWSPLHPSTDGATSWVPQWVCRSCGASTSLLDIPPLDAVSCSLCSAASAIVFDRPSGRAVRFCVPCQRVVSHDSTFAIQWHPLHHPVVTRPIGSRMVLFRVSIHCMGGVRAAPVSPGSGTQSWLFCPLISLGLAHAESNRGIPPYSTGSREHVPPEQSLFWSSHVPHIIQAYATHFLTLDSQQPAAIALQSWQGGHLNSAAQELVTPPDILSMVSVWLSEAVAGFSSRPQAARVPSSAVAPPSCCPPVHVPPHSCLSDPNRVSPPSPFSVVSHSPPVPPSPSPFASLQRPSVTAPDDPPVVSGPFAQHPTVPISSSTPVLLPSTTSPAGEFSSTPHSEFGPPRLTRFLEMPLDRYVNIVTAMINDGRFSHIGHGVLRLQGQTAWGVWLRINHWDSSQGRRARLRVGVLYHVGNRTLTFHGSASVVRQLLLPLFQDWTHATMASLPSVSQVGNHQAVEAPSCVPPTQTPPSPAPHVPHAQPSGPYAPPHRCQGCQELMSIVRRLTFQLQALQTEVHRMVIAAGRPAPVPPAQVPAPPSTPSPIGAPPTTGAPSSFPPPPPPLPVRSCSRRGCTSLVLPLCTTGYCDIHCHSHRCHFHHPSSPAPHPPTTLSARSGNPPRRPLQVCRAVGCPSPPHNRCTVGYCSVHCTSRRCRRRTPPPPLQPQCRHSGCTEPAPPGCPVRFRNLHCTSPRCTVHDPLSLSGNGQGAACRRMTAP